MNRTTLTRAEQKEIKARIREIDGILNEPSTQKMIPYTEMFRDGICQVPRKYFNKTGKQDFYSKTLKFGDINYQLSSDEEQTDIFEKYCDLLNYFDDSIHFQLTFETRRRDNEVLLKKLDIPKQDDGSDNIRVEYSEKVLKAKLMEGDNGNELVKFLTFGVFAKNLKEARPKINNLQEKIIGLFKKASVEVTPLSGKARLAVLYRALNPNRRNRFLFDWDFMKKIGSTTKDYIAPSSICFSKNNFELGDCYGSVMSVNLIASELNDRILFDFLEDNQLLCINIHANSFDQIKAQDMVNEKLLNVKAMKADKQRKIYMQGGDIDNLPGGMKEAIEELEELLKDVKSKNERLFNVTLTLRSYANSQKKMKLQCETLRRICQKNSCILIPLDYMQEDGLAASLPLGVNKILNRRLLHTSSLAAFMPFVSRELFDIDNPRALYFGLNTLTHRMILADVLELSNPNTLVLGKPGSGKTFFVKRMQANISLKTKDDMFTCDPEGEYSPLVSELKGQIIKLSSSSTHYINPMDITYGLKYDSDEDPIAEKSTFLVSFMELAAGGKYGLTPQEHSFIDRAVRSIYEKFLRNPSPETMPTLENLYDELRKFGEPTERMTTALDMYVHGSYNLFNHHTNVDISNRTVCFDIKNLNGALKKIGMLTVMESVWNRVSANRAIGKNTWFFCDEFHLLLRDEQTAKYSVEIWKRFRKWGGIPVGITQNVSDFLATAEIENIFKNTEFTVLLNQSRDDQEILMQAFSISEQQMQYVTNAEPGSGILKFGEVIIPFTDKFPTDTILYRLMTTKLSDLFPKQENGSGNDTEKKLVEV